MINMRLVLFMNMMFLVSLPMKGKPPIPKTFWVKVLGIFWMTMKNHMTWGLRINQMTSLKDRRGSRLIPIQTRIPKRTLLGSNRCCVMFIEIWDTPEMRLSLVFLGMRELLRQF